MTSARLQLRERARRRLIEGDVEGAGAPAGEAERLAANSSGDALVRVTSLLAAASGRA
jgi:hypothetical protein